MPSTPRHARFQALVTQVFDDLFRFALRLERDPVAAEDLLQQALVTGLTRLDQLRDDGAYRVWQTRILVRTHQNHIRRRTERAMPPEALENVVPLAGTGPHRQLERARVVDRVADAIDALPAGQREALLLVDVEGFAFAEAAEVLELPWGTVASRVARARGALRVALADVAREQGVIQ